MDHFYKTLPGLCTFEDYYAWVANEAARTLAVHGRGESWYGVEIGVFGGQSVAFLATELINLGVDASVKIDLVDEFTHPQAQIGDVIARLEPVRSVIGGAHRGCSWKQAIHYKDQSLDFVFIDTEHTLETTRKEIAAFLPKMKIGGIMGGHDFSIHFPGVIRAVTENFPKYDIWRGRNDHEDSFLDGKYMPCWSAYVTEQIHPQY